MKIALGSDHAGYQLKRQVMDHLHKQGIECEDFGAPNAVDAASYVPAAGAVSRAVLEKRADYGIVICGTGLGISIAANKYKGIRAALCTNEYMARMSRQHNNANVLSMGARVIGSALAFPSSTPSCPSLSRWVAAIRLGWTKSPPLRKPISNNLTLSDPNAE